MGKVPYPDEDVGARYPKEVLWVLGLVVLIKLHSPISPVGRHLPKLSEQPSLLYDFLTLEGPPDTLEGLRSHAHCNSGATAQVPPPDTILRTHDEQRTIVPEVVDWRGVSLAALLRGEGDQHGGVAHEHISAYRLVRKRCINKPNPRFRKELKFAVYRCRSCLI